MGAAVRTVSIYTLVQTFMQDYSSYDVNDFVMDENFCRWVIHGRDEDNIFWETWIRKNPDRNEIVDTACQLVRDLHHAQNFLSDEELNQELKNLVHARKTKEDFSPQKPRKWPKYFSIGFSMLALGIGIYYFNSSKNQPRDFYTQFKTSVQDKNEKFIEIVNNDQTIKPLRLDDGSMIKLSPRSRVSYPSRFSEKERRIFLNGEAYFEVTKNAQKPFTVYTLDVITTVLGTSFTIKAFDQDKNVKVVVKTGKVTVSTTPERKNTQNISEGEEIVLLPNQQVVYDRDEQKLKRSLIDSPQQVGPVSVAQQNMVFESTPVAEVFKTLEKQYEVQIVYDADVLADCQLTAELGPEPLFTKMKMICRAIQAEYEVIDGQIVVHGKPCK